MSKKLTQEDINEAGALLNLDPVLIEVVCEVEAPRGGFDENGLPTILFEGHKFSEFTDGQYDQSHPTLSYPRWTRRFYKGSNAGEHMRLSEATALDREAALKSASWGKFQLMGFNHKTCGYPELQDFINAMFKDEGEQLKAFCNFLKNDKGGRMIPALRERRWANFARDYNGEGYAINKYDVKLAASYRAHKA